MALAPPSTSSLTAVHLAAAQPPSLCATGLPFPRTSWSPGGTGSRGLTAGRPAGTERPAEKWSLGVSFFPSFLSSKKGKSSEEIKEELLEAIAPLDRGAAATEEDRERIEQIARELEAVNSIKEPLKSALLNGKWELIYTTSRSVLATERMILMGNEIGKVHEAGLETSDTRHRARLAVDEQRRWCHVQGDGDRDRPRQRSERRDGKNDGDRAPQRDGKYCSDTRAPVRAEPIHVYRRRKMVRTSLVSLGLNKRPWDTFNL